MKTRSPIIPPSVERLFLFVAELENLVTPDSMALFRRVARLLASGVACEERRVLSKILGM